MELRDESDNVMTAEEMEKRTDDILAQMDEKGISDKKLRKSVAKVKEESGTFRSGSRVSLDGVVTRDHVSGRDPTRSVGRDGVGTCSDGTKPNLPYYCATVTYKQRKPTKKITF